MEANDNEWPDTEEHYDWDDYEQEADDNKQGQVSNWYDNLSLPISKDKSYIFFTVDDILNKVLPNKLKDIRDAYGLNEDETI